VRDVRLGAQLGQRDLGVEIRFKIYTKTDHNGNSASYSSEGALSS
jgi:hypothetical protein